MSRFEDILCCATKTDGSRQVIGASCHALRTTEIVRIWQLTGDHKIRKHQMNLTFDRVIRTLPGSVQAERI